MKSILAALLLTTAMPALATVPEEIEAPTETATEEAAPSDSGAAAGKAAIDGVMAMLGNIFDTSKLPPIEPARFKLAQVTAAKMLPDGAYAAIMEDMFGNILTPLLSSFSGTSELQISTATGVAYEDVERLPQEKKDAIVALIDPGGKKRGEQIIAIMKPMLAETMAKIEPPIREGMARAYARRFSTGELTAINAFFTTPAGGSFARESFRLQADPEVMQAAFKAMPEMLSGLLGKEAEYKAKFNALPKQRKLAELSEAEMQQLAGLLGTSVQLLVEHRAIEKTDAEAVMSAEDSGAQENGIAAGETGKEPWYLDSNWAAPDQQKTEALGKAYDSLGAKSDAALEKSNAAYKAWEEARAAAIEAARKKFKAKGWQPPALKADM